MNFREYLKESLLSERLNWVDLEDEYDWEYKDLPEKKFSVKYLEGNSKEKMFAYALAKKLKDGKKLTPTFARYEEKPIDYTNEKEQSVTFVSKGKGGRRGADMNVTFIVLKNGLHEWVVAQTSN